MYDNDLKMLLFSNSQNRKTGSIIQSYSSRDTCPKSCPFRASGCYADSYYTARIWKRAENKQDKKYISNEQELTTALSDAVIEHCKNDSVILFRHNVAGDIAYKDSTEIDALRVMDICRAVDVAYDLARENKSRLLSYTYTHCVINQMNTNMIKYAHVHNFCINQSCEIVREIEYCHEYGIPAVITSYDVEKTQKELAEKNIPCVICPATTQGITCNKCKLCTKFERKQVVIFPVHGNGKKKAQKEIEKKEEYERTNIILTAKN